MDEAASAENEVQKLTKPVFAVLLRKDATPMIMMYFINVKAKAQGFKDSKACSCCWCVQMLQGIYGIISSQEKSFHHCRQCNQPSSTSHLINKGIQLYFFSLNTTLFIQPMD